MRFAAAALLILPVVAGAQTTAYDSSFFAGMSWHNIGPNRAGTSSQ